jgi:hypothetical protein
MACAVPPVDAEVTVTANRDTPLRLPAASVTEPEIAPCSTLAAVTVRLWVALANAAAPADAGAHARYEYEPGVPAITTSKAVPVLDC